MNKFFVYKLVTIYKWNFEHLPVTLLHYWEREWERAKIYWVSTLCSFVSCEVFFSFLNQLFLYISRCVFIIYSLPLVILYLSQILISSLVLFLQKLVRNWYSITRWQCLFFIEFNSQVPTTSSHITHWFRLYCLFCCFGEHISMTYI